MYEVDYLILMALGAMCKTDQQHPILFSVAKVVQNRRNMK